MKKGIKILLTVLMLITLTGCGTTKELDLDKIKISLNELSSDVFEPALAFESIEKTIITSEEPEYIYDFLEYGIDSNDLDYGYGIKDKDTGDELVLFLPLEDAEDKVKSALEKYKDNNDGSIEEYNNYLVYIKSDKKEDIMDIIKKSNAPIFSNLQEVNGSDINAVLDIEESWYSEILMMQPSFIVQANEYIIVKVIDGHKQDVKEKIDEYMTKYEAQWETYLPDQYELVKNREYVEYGDYLIYVISTNNDLVIDTIKKA